MNSSFKDIFKKIADYSPHPCFILNSECIITYISPSIRTITAHSHEYLKGKDFFTLFTNLTEIKVREGFNTFAMNSSDDVSIVECAECKSSGMRVNIHISKSSDTITGTVYHGMIIPDVINPPEKVYSHIEEEKLRAMIEYGSDVITVMDTNGIIVYESPSVTRILGYSQEEVVGHNAFSFLHPDDVSPMKEAFIRLTKNSELNVASREVRIRKKDGTWITAEATGANQLHNPAVNGFIVTYRDVTEQRKYLERIAESEKRYRMLAENMSDVLWIMDIETLKLTYVSSSSRFMIGYKPEEIIQLPMERYITRESFEMIIRELGLELEKEKNEKTDPNRYKAYNIQYIRKNGSTFWAEIVVRFLRNEEGIPESILGVSRDITERVIAEGKLRESEERMRILIETTSDVIYTLDKNGNFNYISPRFDELTGHSTKELMGRHFKEFMSDVHSPTAIDNFETGMMKRMSSIYECIMTFPSGESIPLELNVTSLTDDSGNIIGRLGVARDITRRKEAEKVMRLKEEKYRTIIETIDEGYYETDVSGIITLANRAMCRMTGYQESEVLGRRYPDFMDKVSVQKVPKVFNRVFESGMSARGIIAEFIRKDGSSRLHEISVSLILGADGEKTGFRGIIRDITELRKHTDRIAKLNDCFIRFGTNPDGNIIRLASVCQEIFGSKMVSYSRLAPGGLVVVYSHNMPEALLCSMNSDVSMCRKVLDNDERSIVVLNELSEGAGSFPAELSENYGIYMYVGKSIIRNNRPAGILCQFLERIVPFGEQERKLLEIITAAIAIEEERNMVETALKDSELRYRLLAENSSDVIWTMDLLFNYTYISPSVRQLSGFTPEEQTASGFLNTFTDDSAERAVSFIKAELEMLTQNHAISPFSRRTLELRQHAKNGTIIDVEVNFSFIIGEDGGVTGILGISRDINERKKAEMALRQSEERLRERNEIIEKDLKTAQLIQRQLINFRTKSVPGLVTDFRYLPLDAIGGDYFSFTDLQEGGIGVFIGDVSSHGVTAALFLSLIKATTDRICRLHALKPAEYIMELNRELLGNMPLSFLTAVYGLFQPSKNGGIRYTFANAGHPCPILHRASGAIEFVQAKGTLIGMLDHIDCHEKSIELEKGDRLYLYTDGLAETMNPEGKIIEFDGLPDIIRESTRENLSETLDGIIAAVNRFRAGAKFVDDIILIGFEIG